MLWLGLRLILDWSWYEYDPLYYFEKGKQFFSDKMVTVY
jgi:hypothetical protein